MTASHTFSLYTPSMANLTQPFQSSIILLFLLLLTTANAAASRLTTTSTRLTSTTTLFQEHERMLEALRRHGYVLFTNAIATSDLQYQLLTTTTNATTAIAGAEVPTSPFTLFAPADELLFALDMSSDADVYVSTLKYHVIPNRRHTFADLQNLTSPFLETLLPHYSVLIGKTLINLFDNATAGVMVDGVRLTHPDLFLGSRIAVHGIDGILLTGLNLNHQFDHNDNGSDLFAPVGSPAEMPGLERNITAEGTLPPMSQSERENIAAVSPATPFPGKIPVPPPKGKAKKSLSGKKKMWKHRRISRGSHRLMPKGHRRHRLDDL